MISVKGLDRPAQSLLVQAASQVFRLGSACFRTAAEGNRLASRFGLDSEVSEQLLIEALSAARACQRCGRSLGQKRTSLFCHRDPLPRGGGHAAENIIVVCSRCSKVPAQNGATPQDSVGLEERWARFFGHWVFSVRPDASAATVFLVRGDEAYRDRLQHVRQGAWTHAVAYHSSTIAGCGKLHSLIVRNPLAAQAIQAEVERPGKVQMLSSA